MDVFNLWFEAQSGLQPSTNNLLAKTIALHDMGLALAPNTALLDTVVPKVCSQIASLEVAHRQIEESLTILKRFLNNSKTRTPVNSLPPEVLARIFDFVVRPACISGKFSKYEPLVVLSAVCSRWRQVMTHTGWLWSHVDMTLNHQKGTHDPFFPGQLWLERANGAPLHTHHQPVDEEFDAARDLVQVLCPYVKQISGVTFESPPSELVKDFLDLCHTYGDPNSVNSFLIAYINDESSLVHFLDLLPGCFRGLIRLELWGIKEYQLNICQLATLLSNNPLLRTVRLRDLSIGRDKSNVYGNIDLPCLRYLDLRGMNIQGMELLLPLLPACTADLHFEVDVYSYEPIVTATASFLSRSLVTSLFLCQSDPNNYSAIGSYLASVGHLRALCLKPAGYQSQVIGLGELESLAQQGALSNLQALFLVNGEIPRTHQNQLKYILPFLSLRKIAFVSCTITESGRYGYPRSTVEKEFLSQMSSQVPSVAKLSADPRSDAWGDFVWTQVIA